MDNAVALSSNMPMAVPAGFGARLAAMPARAKMKAAIGVAALVAILVALALNVGQGDYKVLFPSLSDKDASAVAGQLAQMGVAYKVAPGSSAILVPAGQVADLRLKLATAGLPKGSVFGYELMDNARFGQTQFQERLTFQRGLEGELTRSITSLAAVQNARVHLALPNQNGFFREQQKPSASVLLSLHSGRTLDRSQLAGIVHLVSSSVPELDPKAVSVLDQNGTLLTSSAEPGQSAGLDAGQLQYLSQVETGYSRRIVDLLAPIVGANNLRASVAAEIDFSQSEATSEEFKPNRGAEAAAAIRSQQSSEQAGAGGGQPSGVPGAASNQPPIAATAPLTGASQPTQGAPLAGGSTSGRRDSVTNYEVDKTVRVTRNATGVVKRLAAAVVVNNRTVVDAKGKATQVPLAADEIEKLTALVRESIGFKQDRGDTLKVINAPFKVDTFAAQEAAAWWKQPDTVDLVRAIAMPGALAVVALLIFFGLVKPALRSVVIVPPPALLPAPGAGGGVEISATDVTASGSRSLVPLPVPASNEHLESVRLLARQNPAAVAGILRTWVGKEPSSIAPH